MINFPEGIEPSPCRTIMNKLFKRDRHGVTAVYVKDDSTIMPVLKVINRQSMSGEE